MTTKYLVDQVCIYQGKIEQLETSFREKAESADPKMLAQLEEELENEINEVSLYSVPRSG